MDKHLENIDECIRKEIVEMLFSTCPTYRKIIDPEDLDMGVYLLLNGFAMCVSRNLVTNESESLNDEAFSFINNLGESFNQEIINLLKVGVLEMFYDNPENYEVICNRLKGKSKDYYVQMASLYRL